MERKLGSALAEMMQEHNDSNFAPTYNVLMGSIRDALRYTFVVEPDVYCAAVRLTEQYLIDKGCTLTAKNFWQDPPDPKDRKTMYMGAFKQCHDHAPCTVAYLKRLHAHTSCRLKHAHAPCTVGGASLQDIQAPLVPCRIADPHAREVNPPSRLSVPNVLISSQCPHLIGARAAGTV